MVTSNTVTITVEAPFSATMSSSTYTDIQVPAFSGVGATPNGSVAWAVFLQSNEILSGSVTADSSGNFSGNIGKTLQPNSYSIVLTDTTTGHAATLSFTVTYSAVKTISLQASATTVTAGSTVTLSGGVFDGAGLGDPGITVYLFINGSEVSSTTTNANGAYSFSVTFNTSGSYNCDVASTTTNT